MTRRELERATRNLAPTIRRAVFAVVEQWQHRARATGLSELERAIAANDVREVVRLTLGQAAADAVVTTPGRVAWPSVQTTPTTAALTETAAELDLLTATARVVEQARTIADRLRPRALVAAVAPPVPVVTFRPGLPDVAATAVQYGGGALRYLRGSAAQAVTTLIQEGLSAGVHPTETARKLRTIVGLGASQAQWVENFRDELEAGKYRTALRRQFVNGNMRRTLVARLVHKKPLTAEEIRGLTEQYATKWRAWHAETVARTMTLDLMRSQQYETMRQAIARGEYPNLRVEKTWLATLDDRVRDGHEALHENTIAFGARWLDESTKPPILREYPGGWNCRCAMRFDLRPAFGTPSLATGGA